jgi:hypothetical protein
MEIVKSGTWEFGWENLYVEMKMYGRMPPPSIDGNLAFEFLQCGRL